MITSQSVRRQIRAIEDFQTKDIDEDMFLAGAFIALQWALEGRKRYKPTSYLLKIPKRTGLSIRQLWATIGGPRKDIDPRGLGKKKSAPT